ncbi:MAG: hypothetical protein AAGJ82_06235, partial [Bacteroidota bacterium]
DPSLENPQQLTFTPDERKTVPVFHPSKERFAYLNADRTPVIMNTDGVVLEILSQWEDVRDLGWSTNGETLFLLVDNTALQFYGPPMDVPSFGIALGPFRDIESVDVNSRNELAITFPGGIAIRSRDPEFETLSRLGNFFDYGFVRFSVNNDDHLTYNELNSSRYLQFNLPNDAVTESSIEREEVEMLRYFYEDNRRKYLVYATETSLWVINLEEDRYTRSLTDLDNQNRSIQFDIR